MSPEHFRPSLIDHWESLYHTTSPNEVSWYQQKLTISLNLINKTNLPKAASILDVGCGASTLVDQLLLQGYENIALLDVSPRALFLTQQRLQKRITDVTWHHGDITQYPLPSHYDLWHDRAVFHFLVDNSERQAYITKLKQALRPKGHLILATFSIGGPKKCSGLDVVQYDTRNIMAELGRDFHLIETVEEAHQTPAGIEQLFSYFWFIRK